MQPQSFCKSGRVADANRVSGCRKVDWVNVAAVAFMLVYCVWFWVELFTFARSLFSRF